MFIYISKDNPLDLQSLRYMKFDHNKIFSVVKVAWLSLIGSNRDNINIVQLLNQYNQLHHSTMSYFENVLPFLSQRDTRG